MAKFCMKCGQELPNNAKFCGNCGEKCEMELQRTQVIKEQNEKFQEKKYKGSFGGGICLVIVGIVLFAVRHSIQSELYTESIRSGWMGMYDEPFSIPLLMILGVLAIVSGLILICVKLIKN